METCNQFGGKYVLVQGFPGGSPVKNPPANAGHADSIPGWEGALEEEMATAPGFLPGEAHRQRSLAACGPWCRRVIHG